MSSFIFFIHFFLSFSIFFSVDYRAMHQLYWQPFTSHPWKKTANHVNLRCVILSTNVLSWRRNWMLHTVSFLILSRLDTRSSLLNQVISAVRILISSFFLRYQHSEPHNGIGTTKVWYKFTLVVFEIFSLHSLLNLLTIGDVIPVIRYDTIHYLHWKI